MLFGKGNGGRAVKKMASAHQGTVRRESENEQSYLALCAEEGNLVEDASVCMDINSRTQCPWYPLHESTISPRKGSVSDPSS